jgi:hypothetical protein
MTIRLASLVILGIALACVAMSVTAAIAAGEEVPRMTKEQAKAMLGNPDLVILDVRKAADWDGSDSKIQGAIREDPTNINAWADKYPKDKTLLLYCN